MGGGNGPSTGGGGGSSPRAHDPIPKCTGPNDTNCRDDKGLRITITPNYDPPAPKPYSPRGSYPSNDLPSNTPDNFERYSRNAEINESLAHTFQYHRGNAAKAFTNLTKEEETSVIRYASKLCAEGKCEPDTDSLKQAIKQVIYDAPAHHVLGWYKSQEAPGVQFYKNLNKQHSQKIIETAKELAYGKVKSLIVPLLPKHTTK